MADMLYSIRSQKDIEYFLEQTNGLHDGYLVGVQYVHRGYEGGDSCRIDPALSELRIRYMVTSICDALVELVFTSLAKWQIKDDAMDVTDISISIEEDSKIVWTDCHSTLPEIRKNGSYVVAKEMKWHFVHD